MSFDLDAVRACFPALAIRDEETPRVYLDNPGGTQVPRTVLDRMAYYLIATNANLGGRFRTSRASDSVVDEAREAMSDLLNAPSPREIVFGPNMTSLTLHLSRSIGLCFEPGDEIVLSGMDHDGNVSPWLLMARDRGLEVKWLPFDVESFEFDLGELEALLSERTRLVCVTAASNFIGTVNDVRSLSALAREAGAWTYVDAVQAVPHVPVDVQAIGCDFLVCSAYKFFGPHQGVLWGRREVLERLQPYKVRAAPATLPACFETGTQSHEAMAGTTAAVDYLAWVGESMSGSGCRPSGRRAALHSGLTLSFDYEKTLTRHLLRGLQSLPGTRVLGITADNALDRRVPTVSFTVAGREPAGIAAALAERNIFVWSGFYYALEAAAALGVKDSGGAVRVGPVHYNSMEEVDFFLNATEDIITR